MTIMPSSISIRKKTKRVRIADQWLCEILGLLYRKRKLTRSEITQATGLNPASVSYALRYVLERGLMLKTSGEVNGRRRELFDLNAEAGFFVAIDLEGDRIRFALTNLLGDVRFRWEEPLPFRQPLEPRKLIEGIGRVVRDKDTKLPPVLAIGVSYPGLLDSDGRLTAVNLGWDRFPLVQIMNEAFPWPLFLESDKHSCIQAERWLGSAQNCDNALFLIAEGGVGLGILTDGKPLAGACFFPGEIGHLKILPDADDLCNCGERGCLEAIASSPNIVRQYLERGGLSRPGGAPPRVTDVFEEARRGDPAALAVIERAGRVLGLSLSYAITLLNPEIVILGGDLCAAEDLFLPIIKREIERRTISLSLTGVNIRVSSLGSDIRLKGAASQAFGKMLRDPGLLSKLCTSAV